MSTRLYVPPARLVPPGLTVDGDDFGYLVRVLRVRVGDAVTLFDGAGREAPAHVTQIDAEHETVALALDGAPIAVAASRLELTLVLALLKGEKMDLVVQKATELGVARIRPAVTAHAVVRLDEGRAGTRQARWQKIAREAARQCGRADAPEIAPIAPLVEALAAASSGVTTRLLLDTGGERARRPLRELLPAGTSRVALAVGPEGGFAPAEVDAACAAGWHAASLGGRVLRAETAALAGLVAVAFALGDLG